MARNRALAAAAGAWLADRLGTEVGTAGAIAGSMASVRLPLAGPVTQARAAALAERLLAAGTDAPPHLIGDAVWLRLSAHAYNTMEDYARLADILARVLPTA